MGSEFLSESITRAERLKVLSIDRTVKSDEQFLRFRLSTDTAALLPVLQIAEVLIIPSSQIVPIPHLPAYVMGVYNWRGEILWIVDLGNLVGFGTSERQAGANFTAIVVHSLQHQQGKRFSLSQVSNEKIVGLVVDRVEDIEWCNSTSIQSPNLSATSLKLIPFLRGYRLQTNGEIRMVLDSRAIIESLAKIKHSDPTE
jgi:positive phototaxis protein PixI